MKIKQQDGPPSELLYFDNEMNLTKDHVEDIVEIFNTPLTGAYNWDYTCLLYTSPSPRDRG